MSKGSIAAIIAAVFIIGLVGFNLLVADGSEDNPVTTSIRDGENTVVTQEEAESTPTSEAGDPIDQPRGVFEPYSMASFTSAQDRGDKVVAFYSAAWCPTCQNLKRNINSGVVPDGLTILEVDYDTATEMRMEHGVTFQHTLVQLNEGGDAIAKWAGSRNINEILEELI